MLSRIKKNDTVTVISGKDKGKKGTVININTKKNGALVKGINIITKHLKAKKSGETSRIVKEEGLVKMCKLMPVCNACKKACRIQTKSMPDGQKVRICHRCKEAF